MSNAPVVGAIPTEYNGVLFRSRLEARWAIFFDRLNVRWQYEPEGYTDGQTRYLPDFWLPDFDCFWEVKPSEPSESEEAKIWMLVNLTRKDVYVSTGFPFARHEAGAYESSTNIMGMWGDGDDAQRFWDNHQFWCACPTCGRLGIEHDGRGGRVCGTKCPKADGIDRHEKTGSREQEIEAAAYHARSHQFRTATSPVLSAPVPLRRGTIKVLPTPDPPADLPVPGTRVRHERFGDGVIESAVSWQRGMEWEVSIRFAETKKRFLWGLIKPYLEIAS